MVSEKRKSTIPYFGDSSLPNSQDIQEDSTIKLSVFYNLNLFLNFQLARNTKFQLPSLIGVTRVGAER